MVQELIYPRQESTHDEVIDKGIEGKDTHLWIGENSTTFSQDTVLGEPTYAAWILSANTCSLSGIDIHNQFQYEERFPNILAGVFEVRLDSDNKAGFDFYLAVWCGHAEDPGTFPTRSGGGRGFTPNADHG